MNYCNVFQQIGIDDSKLKKGRLYEKFLYKDFNCRAILLRDFTLQI